MEEQIYQQAAREGKISKNGLLCVTSGQYTARYAQGKYIVDEGDQSIAYNDFHRPIAKQTFQDYWQKSESHVVTDECYQVGNHALYNVHVRVRTEMHWHQLFADHLFLAPEDHPLETWELRCIPSLRVSDEHPVFIGICMSTKQVLITGTGYAGEIKKSMFSVMNLILPKMGVLSMHCSAVLTKSNQSTLLLGLSGTGKTSLSSSEDFSLIGDDEHGWSDDGIFNLEGGCYAKTINLSPQHEPEIFHALKPPAILENTLLDEDLMPDFTNTTITENQRAAYPLSHIPDHHSGIAPHPKDIIFLCCDLYGVIPAVSWLTPKQAAMFYMVGYTAKVGATEVGMSSIQPVSSPCFGHPFFARHLAVYQKLFEQKLLRHQPRVWLVNTGWGPGGFEHGSRISISDTRKIIHAITHQCLNDSTLSVHQALGLRYLTKIKGINRSLALPNDWVASQQYQESCSVLKQLFQDSQPELLARD